MLKQLAKTINQIPQAVLDSAPGVIEIRVDYRVRRVHVTGLNKFVAHDKLHFELWEPSCANALYTHRAFVVIDGIEFFELLTADEYAELKCD